MRWHDDIGFCCLLGQLHIRPKLKWVLNNQFHPPLSHLTPPPSPTPPSCLPPHHNPMLPSTLPP
ncbi:hypothetical protein HanXRQr2_Chr04g0186791 [Helianthus annuus]|uniref:Uncharacterized protein n=1 Tax=Helianthus annuus TaxID=4232 RepID=A0A9K3NTX0_HELAN|nr:hypothetical protein HanXRQr2_Chr04g0186791 [Helianthus annuus]